jgi:hypothetical protein
MEAAELFDEGFGQRCVRFEGRELVGVFKQFNDALDSQQSKPMAFNGRAEGLKRTRLIMLTIVALPATSMRNAI